MIKYKRILLKLSGEALAGKNGLGLDHEVLHSYCRQIKEVSDLGVQVGIVVGGGNIFRGLSAPGKGIDRVKGDYMGMLATVINGLAMHSILEDIGARSRIFNAIAMEPVAERYTKPKVIQSLEMKEICLFTFGTGNPFFTTDTAAALRAVEMGADALLKGTRVNGVYSADPEKDPEAKRFEEISFDEVLKRNLQVMDQTAFTMCRENNLPIVVFNMNDNGALKQIISGEKIGTLVKN